MKRVRSRQRFATNATLLRSFSIAPHRGLGATQNDVSTVRSRRGRSPCSGSAPVELGQRSKHRQHPTAGWQFADQTTSLADEFQSVVPRHDSGNAGRGVLTNAVPKDHIGKQTSISTAWPVPFERRRCRLSPTGVVDLVACGTGHRSAIRSARIAASHHNDRSPHETPVPTRRGHAPCRRTGNPVR